MSTRRPSAPSVIFDLDGTLVDSEPNYYEAGRRVLARHGVPDFTWEHHARYIGISTRETLTALRAEYGIETPVDELLACQDALYLDLARDPRPRCSRRCGSSWSGCARRGSRRPWHRVRPEPRSRRCSRAPDSARTSRRMSPPTRWRTGSRRRMCSWRPRGGSACGGHALHRGPLCGVDGRRSGVHHGGAALPRWSGRVHGADRLRLAGRSSAFLILPVTVIGKLSTSSMPGTSYAAITPAHRAVRTTPGPCLTSPGRRARRQRPRDQRPTVPPHPRFASPFFSAFRAALINCSETLLNEPRA